MNPYESNPTVFGEPGYKSEIFVIKTKTKPRKAQPQRREGQTVKYTDLVLGLLIQIPEEHEEQSWQTQEGEFEAVVPLCMQITTP